MPSKPGSSRAGYTKLEETDIRYDSWRNCVLRREPGESSFGGKASFIFYVNALYSRTPAVVDWLSWALPGTDRVEIGAGVVCA